MLRFAAHAMRTRFEIVLADTDRSEASLRAAGEAALAEIADVEAQLSAYRPDSDVYRINAQAGVAPVRIRAPLLSLLEQVRYLSLQTDGTFDPTVGPLLDLWNHAQDVPTAVERDTARSLVNIGEGLLLDADVGTAFLTREGMRLDPGAWGKGYGLDVAAELLQEMGIRNALIHGGTSTAVALGTPPDKPRGWPIAIQHPLHADRHLSTVYLQDATLSVSAVHGRTFYARDRDTGDTRSFGHVVDPRTGVPVARTLLAAVVAPNGLTSDAVSTALLVGGADIILTLAERFAGASLLIAEEDGERPGDVTVSAIGPAFQDAN